MSKRTTLRHFLAKLESLTRQQHTGYVDSLCCFDSDTSWPISYHVNSIDLTAHPNEEDFSLLWDGIRFLSHRHTITVPFHKYPRLSHWNNKKKRKEKKIHDFCIITNRHKEKNKNIIRVTWNADRSRRRCENKSCVFVWVYSCIFVVIYKQFFCPQGLGHTSCGNVCASFSKSTICKNVKFVLGLLLTYCVMIWVFVFTYFLFYFVCIFLCVLFWLSTSCLCLFPALVLFTPVFHLLIICVFVYLSLVFSPYSLSVCLFLFPHVSPGFSVLFLCSWSSLHLVFNMHLLPVSLLCNPGLYFFFFT